ncbi:hypothetical protein [Aquimarina spongiae]|uniref:Uncharacterized protein n=1 Tax=Aquimarina spongiae TaxID=570521 RepID=A0A1M6A4K3_9FLAO|nr:hypothetical protein [Aquimarina spongiae]SHI31386.1 hypothetical protein SAMN04488508_10181 [Aquimarina spongiae]
MIIRKVSVFLHATFHTQTVVLNVMKENLTLIILVLVSTVTFSQNDISSKKDSITEFLIRGLWIQYEVEKAWSNNNDTIITYSPEEYSQYYQSERVDENYSIQIDIYARKTSSLFEKKTKITRRRIHRTQNLTPVLDKKIIEIWSAWYDRNKSKVSLKELEKITKH